MKIAVVYYSSSGHTAEMAEHIVRGIERVDGVEAKAFSMDEADADYINESCALIVGTPIYAGTVCTKVHGWLEGMAGNYQLAGKLGGAFATAAYVHGGGDLGLLSILQHMMFAGMMTYSGGCACGDPVIHLGPEAVNANEESFYDLFEVYGERMARQAAKIF